MRKLDMTRDAYEFLKDLQAKQFKQVANKIFALLADPEPADASQLKGYDYHQTDFGEYRIVYKFDVDTVYVVLIGKRNDDEVYKDLKKKS
jgi:mRNA interferase RelE/StbE